MNTWRKNLVESIVDECQEKNVTVSKDFVSFILHLYQLNPTCRMNDIHNDEEATEKSIRMITEKLMNQSSPSLVTLKIQLYFAKHYSCRNEIVKKQRLKLQKKTNPLVAEVCEATRTTNDRDIEKLYQKILIVVTLLSGLGNPMEAPILKEAAVALQSVYLPSELTHFVILSRAEKEKQLMELVNIVAGIRLFNKDCQRGGEGIDDLPNILQEAIEKSRESILELLEILMKKVYRLTAAVENIVIMISMQESDRVKSFDDGRNDDDIFWIIEMLTACRQQEIYIRKLLADVELCENDFKELMNRLQARLLKLHDTVRYRTAIPTLQVYPQFIDLADVWTKLQDQFILLSNIKNLILQLRSLSKNIEVHDESKIDMFIRDSDIPSDAERLEQSMGKLITECGECQILYPNSTKDFEKIPLEFLGFCAYTFVSGHGALIPGNPNIGVSKWRTKYFAFSSIDAAKYFGEDPNRYVYEALDFVLRHPEYIQLFQLHEEVEDLKNQEIFNDDGNRRKVHQDQSIQTDVHVLPSEVDKNYHHSVWEHRRRALRMVEISKLATKSTQTYLSQFKKTAISQTSIPKSTSVQTRRDNGCNTKLEKTLIFGLRGRKENAQRVITFSLD